MMGQSAFATFVTRSPGLLMISLINSFLLHSSRSRMIPRAGWVADNVMKVSCFEEHSTHIVNRAHKSEFNLLDMTQLA